MKTVIHWFRRDLRVSDNTALHEADLAGERVVPVFCWDEAILRSPDVGGPRVAFLLESLRSLASNLEALGHRLIVRRGRPEDVLVGLAAETGADAVHANRDYEPYARERDARVAAALGARGVAFRAFKDSVIWEEREVLTGSGGVYTVFTPYSRSWRARAVPAPRPRLAPARVPSEAGWASEPLPASASELGHPCDVGLFPAGERAGLKALDEFLRGRVERYGTGRDTPSDDGGTSRLSPHLRFGTVNVRTALERLGRARASVTTEVGRRGCEVWETELIWREFYAQVLANHPHVARGAFRREYDALAWEGREEWFGAWCAGATGYPIVDAAMRCLNATGWMHNRLRMIVAMFLTKDLLVSWQRGEQYFMQRLVDGDLAANNGGWQWSAGTGTDAAPYFRIFNPVSQGEKFDPQGVFVRRWLPELADVPDRFVHRPWEDPGRRMARSYPARIVDHGEQRERCLRMFKAVRGAVEA